MSKEQLTETDVAIVKGLKWGYTIGFLVLVAVNIARCCGVDVDALIDVPQVKP